jgi:hypothetical protein
MATTDLAQLVAAEARLDRELAAARVRAGELEQAARQRADEAAAALAAALATERAGIAAAIEHETTERLRQIDEAVRADVARFDSIRGARATELAREVAEQLVALVCAEEAT